MHKLTRGIRDQSTQATAVFLGRRAQDAQLDFNDARAGLDEILEVFGATLRDSENRPSTSDPREDGKDSLSVTTSPVNSTDEERADLWMPAGIVNEMGQPYERWLRYSMEKNQNAQVAGAAALILGRTGGDNDMEKVNVNRNISWPQIAGFPSVHEQLPSSPNDREG